MLTRQPLSDIADRIARLLGRVSRGVADSPIATQTLTVAPAANAILQTTGNVAAGVWEVYATVSIGPGGLAADHANTKLQLGATNIAELANPAVGSQTFGPFRVTAGGGSPITVRAIGAGTAGVQYAATIAATQIE